MIRWFLEGYFQNDSDKTQQHLRTLPQIVGRDESLTCVISAPSVSRNHAEIFEKDGLLWIRDMDSRNGTYVNRNLISSDPVNIDHGDVLHFGTVEVRLINSQHSRATEAADEDGTEETKIFTMDALSQNFPSGVRELEKLIETKAVAMVFQPIIRAQGLKTVGYEILGRGASPDLPNSPLELFNIAESFGLEVRLSEIMREKGIEIAATQGLKGEMLVNTHPSEMNDPDRLLQSLKSLRSRFPNTSLTLEIHEQCVTGNNDLLRALKKKLDLMSIKLAFDDFGVGQSRLMEMVEAKPNLIKFDRLLIDKIDTADESRINLLRHLKELASELSILTLAECVATEGEYRVCETMGFEFYQGFYFAKPQPAENFVK